MKWEGAIVGAALGVAALALTDGVAIIVAAAGATSGFASLAADICADDPPDPDYKAIFVPTVPRLPRVRTAHGLTPKAARALRRMSANYVRFAAYMTAWIRSIEKAQGAAQAHDDQWASRHRAAAAKYARIAATALESDHRLRTKARHEFRRGGFRHFKITSAQVRKWQRQIKTHGLPRQTEKILRDAKIDVQQRQALRHDLLQLNPKTIAKFGVFGELDDKRYQQANTAMVHSMRESADSLSA